MGLRQTEIKQILFDNDKPRTWLAQRLGVSDQSLAYKLNNAKALSVDDYDAMIKIFQKEGFITSSKEQCDFLLKQALNMDSVMGSTLSGFSELVLKVTEDDFLEFREKRVLLDRINKSRMEINNTYDAIEKIVEGRK